MPIKGVRVLKMIDMKKILFIALVSLGLAQQGQSQASSDDMKLPFDALQQEMMKMLEQMGFEQGGSNMMIDTMMIQPFGLFPGIDSLGNQDFMKQWQTMSEQLMKSLQGEGGMNGFEELFKNFPGFDQQIPPSQDPKSLEEGTKPKKKKRKTYKI